MIPNPQTVQAKAARRWSQLALVWAVYYFFAFTLGQIPEYAQKTIWWGAGLVGLITLPVLWRHGGFRHLPREGILLILFTLWAATGWFFATNPALFLRYMKLVLMLTMIVTAVAIILRQSGAVHWFYLAYLGVAVYRILYGEGPVNIERVADTQAVDRIASANAIGYGCVLGIIGMLALIRETRSFWFRAGLLAGSVVALYGVVLSASRGALVALMATAVLWPAFCLVGSSKFKAKAVTGAVIVLILAFFSFQFIIKDTYMGVRFTSATQLEDGSSQMRLELFITGLQAFVKNPIFGIGLGQFGTISRTGQYAHNEFAELLATTGLPGVLIYYPIYVLAWRRLSRSLYRLSDPLLRYRINIVRMILLILLISGMISRPVFITQDTMFLLGIVVGMAHWAERMAGLAGGNPPATAPALAWPAPGFPGRIAPNLQTPAFRPPPGNIPAIR